MTSEQHSEWDQEKERIKKVVDDCVSRIKEHVDAVQIIISHHNDDSNNTMSYEKGSGNWHARIGVTQEWLETQRQFVKNWAIREDQKEE